MPEKDPANIGNLSNIIGFLQILLFALFGGISHYLKDLKDGKEKLDYLSFFSRVLISGFCGIIAGFICSHFQVSQNLTMFVVGMAGWSGIEAIMFAEKIIKKYVYKKTGFEETKEDKNKCFVDNDCDMVKCSSCKDKGKCDKYEEMVRKEIVIIEKNKK